MGKKLFVFFVSFCFICFCVNIYIINNKETNKVAAVVTQQISSSSASSKGASGSAPAESSSGILSVPGLLGTGIEIEGINNTDVGMIAWSLVGVAILIILIMLFRNKTNNKSFSNTGRKRYKRGLKQSKKKRLLSDKYYNKLKYK